MKIVKVEDLHCDAGWRVNSFLKITTDEGLVGWSEYMEGYGAQGLTGVILKLAERFLGAAHLVIEIERVRDETRAAGPDQHRPDSAEQHRARHRRDLGLRDAVAHQRERIGGGGRSRREVIRPVEINIINLVARHEGLNLKRLVGLRHRLFNLLRLEWNVIASAGLVALDLLLRLDRFPCFRIDKLAVHAMPGLAV